MCHDSVRVSDKIRVYCIMHFEPCIYPYLSCGSKPPVVFSSGYLCFKLSVLCPHFLTFYCSFHFLFKNNSTGSRGKRYFQEFVFLCGFWLFPALVLFFSLNHCLTPHQEPLLEKKRFLLTSQWTLRLLPLLLLLKQSILLSFCQWLHWNLKEKLQAVLLFFFFF